MARSAAFSETDSLVPYLKQLRALPFVRQVERLKLRAAGSRQFDALIRVQTHDGTCDYLTEEKRSYLDAATTEAILSRAKAEAKPKAKLLLLARYIPRPTAQRLIDGAVDFIDLAGNIHIHPVPNLHWTVIGNRERRERGQRPTATAATLQVLFTIAAHAESASWTVRELADAAGVSKSKAASVRRDLIREGVLREAGGRFLVTDPQYWDEQLLSGYRHTLRPKLVIGRFRQSERGIREFVQRLGHMEKTAGFRHSLSGAPAAYILQKLYRGTGATVFVAPASPEAPRRLRLLPDREGPVTLLKAFTDWIFWRSAEGVTLAHPWLIYAELMAEQQPRAREAAVELRREFLRQ